MSKTRKYRQHFSKLTHTTLVKDFKIEIVRQYSPHRGRFETDQPESLTRSPPWWNFAMYLDDDYTDYHEDLHDGTYLCDIALIRRRDFMWETHCDSLPDCLLGMGFGGLLYRHVVEFALKTNKTICSSHNTSESAISVWQKMSEDYFIFNGLKNYIILGPRQKTA